MIELIGRFHPVLVHLPIGILFLACIFQVATVRPRFGSLQAAIPAMSLWGAISAVASCITGYFLSLSGDYQGSTLSWHQWMGISTAAISIVMYALYRFNTGLGTMRLVSVLLIILITVTGHLGGSLTHGSDFLTAPLNTSGKGSPVKPMPDVQQAAVYADMVQPLLQARCYSCHGPDKQKGELRMDLPEHLMKGGESGKLFIAGNAAESELIRRLLLPLDDDDHMPPKEKSQLSQQEIALLHWWVSTGAGFTAKVNQLSQTAGVKTMLQSFQTGAVNDLAAAAVSELPEDEVAAAGAKDLERLDRAGFVVMPVAQSGNYLSANGVNAVSFADTVMQALAGISKQLLWLKLERPDVSNATLKTVASFKNLTRLHLANAGIDDRGLAALTKLDKLQVLNLTGTGVTAKGILSLKGLESLRSLYLYKTKVGPAEQAILKKAFPKTTIDFGNYVVPTLETDTTLVELPKTD